MRELHFFQLVLNKIASTNMFNIDSFVSFRSLKKTSIFSYSKEFGVARRRTTPVVTKPLIAGVIVKER